MTVVVSSATFGRDELSLTDLVISNDFTQALYLPEGGSDWPRFTNRKTYAPESPWVPGKTLLSRVRDLGTIPLTVYARGTSTANMKTAMDAFDATVDQWAYDLTLVVDGVTMNLTGQCVDDLPSWGEIDPGMVRAHIARGSVVIPLTPS